MATVWTTSTKGVCKNCILVKRYITTKSGSKNKMSSTVITPGAKAENAVYLASGLTLGLYLFRIYNPDLFNDVNVRSLVAAALVSHH